MECSQGQKWKTRLFSTFPNPDAWGGGGGGGGGLDAYLSTSVGCWSDLFPIGSVLKGAVGSSGGMGQGTGMRDGCRWPGE